MDTETVFKIIDMLDARISNYGLDKEVIQESGYDMVSKRQLIIKTNGSIVALEELKNYLQEYIESEVSKAEDQMNEGEY